MFRTVLSAAACLTLLASPVMAAAPTPASKDPKAVVAGTYNLDPRHASIIARVGHGGGVSYSTFRFGTVSGSLTVDPANPNASKVTVTVDPKSITSNVDKFAEELGGERFLNTAKFPQATFTSTGVQASGAKAAVTGNLTLMGQTRPITANVELVGSGKSMQGKAVVGFTGTASFKRSDFGFNTLVGPIGDEVELLIDVEFVQP